MEVLGLMLNGRVGRVPDCGYLCIIDNCYCLVANMAWLRRWRWSVLAAALLAMVVVGVQAFGARGEPPFVVLKSGGAVFVAEWIDSPAGWRKGLQGREMLAERAAMLFAFDRVGSHCMWMRDTLIPLSVAWLDDAGRVVDIQDMPIPGSDRQYCSRVPAWYALEVNQGAFDRQGVHIGMQFF